MPIHLNQKGSPRPSLTRPRFRFGEAGIAPVILVIILSVVFVGVTGVVYNSKKEIKIKQDKTYETKKISPSGKPTSVGSDNSTREVKESGRLAKEPFRQEDLSLPKFSFFPPDDWAKEKGGNYVAPTKDKISEGVAYLAVSPSINIAVVSQDFNDLDEALAFMKSEVRKKGIDITSARKTKLNGEDAYFVEGTIKYGELSRDALETEIENEIKKAQRKVVVSEKQIQKDVDQIVKKGDVKVIGYLFYKDGYAITYSGRALVEFWDNRGSQIKRSLDTFKFE